MVTVLAPDASITFMTVILIPLVIGFLAGVITRAALKIGLALVAIALFFITAGMIAPSIIIQPMIQLIRSGTALTTKVHQIAGYLLWSSMTFVVGVAVGFFKG
jgi:hypothetical protein